MARKSMISPSDLSSKSKEEQSGDCSSFDIRERNNTTEGTMLQRVGNVLYTVHVRPAEDAREDYETKLMKVIEQDIMSNLRDEQHDFVQQD